MLIGARGHSRVFVLTNSVSNYCKTSAYLLVDPTGVIPLRNFLYSGDKKCVASAHRDERREGWNRVTTLLHPARLRGRRCGQWREAPSIPSGKMALWLRNETLWTWSGKKAHSGRTCTHHRQTWVLRFSFGGCDDGIEVTESVVRQKVGVNRHRVSLKAGWAGNNWDGKRRRGRYCGGLWESFFCLECNESCSGESLCAYDISGILRSKGWWRSDKCPFSDAQGYSAVFSGSCRTAWSALWSRLEVEAAKQPAKAKLKNGATKPVWCQYCRRFRVTGALPAERAAERATGQPLWPEMSTKADNWGSPVEAAG